jgi:hypothetical protein
VCDPSLKISYWSKLPAAMVGAIMSLVLKLYMCQLVKLNAESLGTIEKGVNVSKIQRVRDMMMQCKTLMGILIVMGGKRKSFDLLSATQTVRISARYHTSKR